MFGLSLSSVVAWIAIYVVVWWITIFVMLPIGVPREGDGATTTPGADPGAPVAPRIGFKALLTTGVSLVIVAVIYSLHGWFE